MYHDSKAFENAKQQWNDFMQKQREQAKNEISDCLASLREKIDKIAQREINVLELMKQHGI